MTPPSSCKLRPPLVELASGCLVIAGDPSSWLL